MQGLNQDIQEKKSALKNHKGKQLKIFGKPIKLINVHSEDYGHHVETKEEIESNSIWWICLCPYMNLILIQPNIFLYLMLPLF